MCDNARERIKIQIKKARPTHLSLTPRKETRKSAVHQLARTYTQERPRHSAKIIADADNICSRKRGQ